MKKYPKPKRGAWFVKIRGSYLPCSWQGALTYVPMIAFLITIVAFTLQNTDSITEALYVMFPYFVCTGVVMHWLAARKS